MKSVFWALIFFALVPSIGSAQNPIEYDFPAEKINIHTLADVETKRQQLIDYIWGGGGMPTLRVPNKVDLDIQYIFYNQLKNPEGNLQSVNQYTIRMANGFSAVVDHFIPVNGNGKVFIYHSGHGYGYWWEDFSVNGENGGAGLVIPALLKLGYSVLAIPLPLQGGPTPTMPTPDGLDWTQYWSMGHIQMFQYLVNPYTYFFDPLIVTLNYVEDTYHYSEINMAGLSGGGWATAVYSALDTRINYSFPVAGSIPLYLRKGFEGYGDAEQGDDYNGLLGVANYVELYTMASAGNKRGQLQINNKFDNCCFYDNVRNLVWVDSVKQKIDVLGQGRYNFFLEDSTLTHRVSSRSLKQMLKFIDYYNNNSLPLTSSVQRTDSLSAGDSTSIEIEARTSNVVYKWQLNKNDGFGFAPIEDGDHYRGTNTAKLYIDSVRESMRNYMYRCTVESGTAPSTTTYSTHLYVRYKLGIVTQPENLKICQGTHPSFTLTAKGDGLRYQWQRNDGSGFTDLGNDARWSGINDATLDIWNPDELDSIKFRCIVSDKYGDQTTTVQVNFAYPYLNITSQPTNVLIASGTTTSFEVTAVGDISSYQWQVRTKQSANFSNIPSNPRYVGTTTRILSINNVPDSFDGYEYRCLVSSPCDTFASTPAGLKLFAKVPIIVNADSPFAAREDGESISLEVRVAGENLEYRWQISDGSGFVDVNNEEFSGANTPVLSISTVDDSISGYIFRCIISGPSIDTRMSETYTLIVEPFTFSINPVDTTTCAGDPTEFRVVTQNHATYYQWQVNRGNGFINIKDSQNYSGQHTDVLVVTKPRKEQSGYRYRCISINGAGKKIISTDAALEVLDRTPVSFELPSNIVNCDEPVELVADIPGGVFKGPGVSQSSFDPRKTNPGAIDITYTYTNELGCPYSVTNSMLVVDCIQESDFIYDLVASPNPSNGIVTVEFATLESVQVNFTVYTTLGQTVNQTTYDANIGVHSVVFDLTDKPKGVYMIALYCNGETTTRRIILN